MRRRVAGLFGVVFVASCGRSTPRGPGVALALDVPRPIEAPRVPASANDAAPMPLMFEDPHDVYTSSTPNPYARFFATNVSSSTAMLRVTRVELKHGADSAPITVRLVERDDHTAVQPIAIRPGERLLVTAFLDDSGRVLDTIHDDVEFAVSVDVDGVVQSVATRVGHATRWPRRR